MLTNITFNCVPQMSMKNKAVFFQLGIYLYNETKIDLKIYSDTKLILNHNIILCS